MAGHNKVLKEGTVLFKAGDESDGMYVIRKGELRVYLEQDGKEVSLATIPAGGMIGEMALFDRKPRSASVKAVATTEVTHISTDDFNRLMKQIPKWFVGLMAALSSRLRDTNARLQRIEQGNKGPSKPYDNVLRVLNILLLLWHKDGEKEGKEWIIQRDPVIKTLVDVFGEDKEQVKIAFEVLVKQQFLSTRRDSYNNVVFCTRERGILNQFVAFLQEFVKNNPKKNPMCLPDEALAMLEVMEVIAGQSPYDSLSASLDDIIREGKRQGVITATWKDALPHFKTGGEGVKLVKTSGGIGLKTSKKEIASYTKYHKCIAALYKANLV